MPPVPLMFLGDSPDLRTGLSRIGRDLALRVAAMPEFRVGYLGRGGCGSIQLPFAQYNFPESEQWGENLIERAWADFSRGEPGVIMTIWDPTRLHWFGHPTDALPDGLRRFLDSKSFGKWGYFPVDSTGPGDRLTALASSALEGYDRVLGYTIWGADILARTLGHEVNWLPHGYNPEAFRPRDRRAARIVMGWPAEDLVVGCVATNQPRKDLGLAFAAMTLLHSRDPRIRFWLHTDTLDGPHRGDWSIRSLISDFAAADWTAVTLSGGYDDTWLSYAYSACDVTILPTLGEGFGYPVVESQACGVPVVTGSYGGQAELVANRAWLVEPVATADGPVMRLAGRHNSVRPVYDPRAFADTVERVLGSGVPAEECTGAVEHLQWPRLWEGCWRRWFLGGLREVR